MFVKLNAGRASNEKMVEIQTVQSENDGIQHHNKDFYDLLLWRQFTGSPAQEKHTLTFLCQHVYHNDLSAYLFQNQSSVLDVPFLSPIRSIRSIDEYQDVNTLALQFGAHAAHKFALELAAADEYFTVKQSARAMFDAITECAHSINSMDLRNNEKEEERVSIAWRMTNFGKVEPENNCSTETFKSFHCLKESFGKSIGSGGVLLLLKYDVKNGTNDNDLLITRLVFDASWLTSHNYSNSHTLLRPLTIVVNTMNPVITLLRLTFIVSNSSQVETLGPYKIVFP